MNRPDVQAIRSYSKVSKLTVHQLLDYIQELEEALVKATSYIKARGSHLQWCDSRFRTTSCNCQWDDINRWIEETLDWFTEGFVQDETHQADVDAALPAPSPLRILTERIYAKLQESTYRVAFSKDALALLDPPPEWLVAEASAVVALDCLGGDNA